MRCVRSPLRLTAIALVCFGAHVTNAQILRTTLPPPAHQPSAATGSLRDLHSPREPTSQWRSDDVGKRASPLRAIAGVGLGALVGGFMGYFVSQLGTSDWEALPSAERSSLRRRYAVSGAVIGGIAGVLLRPRANFTTRSVAVTSPRTGRLVLTSSELRRSVATNVLEAIQMERPEWLEFGGRVGPEQTPTPSTNSVMATPMIFVGDERLENVMQLADIALPEISELRYYDARDAAKRWHVESPHGVIEVVPASENSDR